MRRLIFLALLFVLVAIESTAAPLSCPSVFSAPPSIGSMRQDFVLSTDYDNEIENPSSIKNQCGLGTCHLHTWAAMLETDYQERTDEKLVLSTTYLSAKHLIAKAIETLEDSKVDVAIALGSNSLSSRGAIRRYGLVPESVWKPRNAFHEGVLATRLQNYLQNVIERAKWERDSEDGSIDFKSADENDFEKIIAQIVERATGPMPKSFRYQGKTYTPQSFAQERFPDLHRPIVSAKIVPDGQPVRITAHNPWVKYYEVHQSQVEEMIKKLIDDQEPIYLSYQNQRAFMDNDTGTMSISAFEVPAVALPLSRELSARLTPKNGHAVQIVGYKLDRRGRIVRLKIRNSWGEKSGDDGYWHMHQDFFSHFANSISFFADAPIVMPEPSFVEPSQLHLPL